MKTLAIDTNAHNEHEAERWSELFFAIYNDTERAFSLERFQAAFFKLPDQSKLTLARKFKLLGLNSNSEEISSENLQEALNELAIFDAGETAFSVNALIEYLNEMQNRVISTSSFRKEWNIDIRDLNLSTRATNALTRSGMKTLNDLFSKNYTKILNIRNLGKKSMEEEIIPLFTKYGVRMNY